MKLKAAIKKIENRAKVVDRKVDITQNDYHNNGQVKVYARFEDSNQLLSFWTNSDGTISSPHTVSDGLESDPHTDYFPGSFWDNITQALNYIAPLAPKYSVGSLVRFKDNKRNSRWKLAGKVALVMQAESGGNYRVQYDGSADQYNPFYSERDLELVS
tara:strand:+ start:2087 stop:2560 length:474 start_codon:yes stop_codon:yes gene_type:complete